MNPDALAELAGGIRGNIVSPSDQDYEGARQVWNGTIDRRPALIVRCQGVADVLDAVNYARSAGLGVSVRGGGHHVAGGSVNDGGLVIDLSLMRSVRVDPAAQTVRADGGALIGDLDRETQAFGLAVPMGLVSETGIAGLTLAGGLGWLRRKHGYSSDSLISADVVTGDGRLLHASAAENADLFWALRGGGWDLGVVTSFEYRAYPVGPELMLAFTAYPMSEAPAVLKGFVEYGRSAPPEAAPLAIMWTFPKDAPVPEEARGQSFIAAAGPYIGTVEEGLRALQPLRELGTVMVDLSEPVPYVGLQRLFDEDYPRGRRYYWKSTYLREIDDAAVATLIEIGSERPSLLTSLDIWLLGGALREGSGGDSPISHRDAAYLIGLESNWEDAGDDAANIAWSRTGVAKLAPFSTGGSYLNFEDLSEARATAASHGSNFDRLVAIKRKYDPDNLFRSRRGLVD
jgi:FAD/FMN-containing dehydrogenase